MADVISRLKLESGEFDSKIKRAAQGIQRMAEECHRAGGILNTLEDENRKYIQSIGQMETVNKSMRGSVAELTAAFMDMKHVYNQLSEDEKKGEVGRELNKQLTELKRRINEGNEEIKAMQQELNGGLGNALDSIAGKFGMNIKQLTGWGAALGAGKIALDTAKDAFMANETQLDEWSRTVQSSESLYEGFLNALNTGDISGYLSRIDEIINAARDAYDAMDTLSTFNAFTRGHRAGLRSNYSEALNEYKLNPTAENKKVLADANQALVEGLQQQADKIKQSYEKALNSLGVNRLLKEQQLEDFKNLFRSGDWDKLETLKAGYKQGRLLNAGSQYWYGDRVYDGKIQDRFTGKWRVMEEDEKKQFEFARVLSQVNDKQIDAVQALDEQYQNTLDAINNQNRSYNRLSGNNGKPGAGGGGGRGGKNAPEYIPLEGSIDAQTKKVQELQKAWRAAADDDSRERIKKQIDDAQLSLDYMTGKAVVAGSNSRALGYTYGEMFDQQHLNDLNNIVIDLKTPLEALESELKHLTQFRDSAMTGEQWRNRNQLVEAKQNEIDTYMGKGKAVEGLDLKKIGDKMQGLSGGLASLTGGLKQMGIEIPQEVDQVIGVVQGLSTIIQGVQSVIQIFSTSSQAANTIALTANTAALWAVAATNAIPFAGGGIIPHAADGYFVPGNNFSGDITPIMANAGELVLNRAQQGNLASQLQGGGMGGWKLTTKLAGTDLLVSLERTLQKQGYGRLATWQ